MASFSRSFSRSYSLDSNDPVLERRRLYSTTTGDEERPVSSNTDYIYATWQNAMALDNARRLLVSINQRSKDYYTLTCIDDNTLDDSENTCKMEESGLTTNSVNNKNLGNSRKKAPLRFEIVSAKNASEDDKKFMLYTIMMKKHLMDDHPAFIKRRYSDFYNLYGILNSKYKSKMFNNFNFPKKLLTNNLKPEQIAKRAKGLETYLNLISSSELVNSYVFEEFLTQKEHNLALSQLNTKLFGDAAILLENVFHTKEKLLTISNISVLNCLVELTACLVEFETYETAFKYCLLSVQSMRALQGHQEVEDMKIPILRTAQSLAQKIGEDAQPFADELARHSYVAYPQPVGTLMDIVRGRGKYQSGR
eukprot:GFUD01003961.1.p1 GENE.GFUD01003961.1~~GFUD01003961.1.p1  ORF type:complete len:364 (+),score=80.75 GFUD01003961.1:129-1220(+)